jgi:hypothetical protein
MSDNESGKQLKSKTMQPLGFETELRNLTEHFKCCKISGSHSGYEYNYCVSGHHPLQFFLFKTERFGD